MSKTFGQLIAGDEVYVINGNDVEIVKVSKAEVEAEVKVSKEEIYVDQCAYMHITINDNEYSLHSEWTSHYDDMVGYIYCDIDEAIRKMQDIRETAWYNFYCARGGLVYLETKKKLYDLQCKKKTL